MSNAMQLYTAQQALKSLSFDNYLARHALIKLIATLTKGQ